MKQKENLKADENLARFSFLGTLSMAGPVAEMSTWLLTGEAVIIGAVLVNIHGVAERVCSSNLKFGIAALLISMLVGALAKQIGVAIQSALSGMELIESALAAEESLEMKKNLSWSLEKMKNEISSAYLWPMSYFIGKSFSGGAEDPLFGEKKLIKLLCIEIYLANTQNITGALGLLILVLGIK